MHDMEDTNSGHTRGLMRPIGWLAGTTKHHNALIRALNNVLTTDLARRTLGQIVDSFVLYGAFFGDTRAAYGQCSELNADVLLKRGQSRAKVDIRTLRVDAAVLSEFCEAEIDSTIFQQKLIELVARAVHAMAIVLYQKVPDTTWRPDFHPWYSDSQSFPDGEADGVGYWAEDRILGGVVLFDRRDRDEVPNTALEYKNDAVYFHPSAEGTSPRIYQLKDSQRQALLDYLFGAATPSAPEPPATFLPIRCDSDNSISVDPMETTSIYRDKWERLLTRHEQGE
ncbi:hypothetical protein Sste5346_004552 [Sporothrix stenoceras]|uniref:Uncharacterized protein n=1 Tax=Sporothrix stenoceras TaxID=5173 RepID=A0ABR3Z9K8_9PEZI